MLARRLLLMFLLLGCSRPAAPAGATADGGAAESLLSLKESARLTLRENCGECHTGSLSTALPRALAVFDLAKPDWSDAMTVPQLREADRRLREPFGPTQGPGETRPIVVPPEDRTRFDRFLAMEIERRAQGR